MTTTIIYRYFFIISLELLVYGWMMKNGAEYGKSTSYFVSYTIYYLVALFWILNALNY